MWLEMNAIVINAAWKRVSFQRESHSTILCFYSRNILCVFCKIRVIIIYLSVYLLILLFLSKYHLQSLYRDYVQVHA